MHRYHGCHVRWRECDFLMRPTTDRRHEFGFVIVEYIPITHRPGQAEPYRDCRRPKTLRQYSYEKQTILN